MSDLDALRSQIGELERLLTTMPEDARAGLQQTLVILRQKLAQAQGAGGRAAGAGSAQGTGGPSATEEGGAAAALRDAIGVGSIGGDATAAVGAGAVSIREAHFYGDGQAPRRVQPVDPAQAQQIYLHWLRGADSMCYLPLIPVDVDQEPPLLEDVYIPLRVLERQALEGLRKLKFGDFDPSGEFRLRKEAFEALRRGWPVYRLLSDPALLPGADPQQSELASPTTTRLLLMGDPGSGKTATLLFGALTLARDLLAGTNEACRSLLDLQLAQPPLPFYIRLTLVATFVRDKYARATPAELPSLNDAPAALLLDWLDGYLYEQSGKQLPQAFASERLRLGDCLLLLDGLDETGDARERDYIQRLIQNLVAACPHNRVLVASRPYERVALRGFDAVHLSPLIRDEMALLLANWFGALRTSRASPRQAASTPDERVGYLLAVLDASPRLFEMATNPLLLTTLALLVQSGTALPRARAGLYAQLVPLLVRRWRESQVLAGAIGRDDDASTRFYQESENSVGLRLRLLAASMQEQSRREIRLGEAQDILRPVYRDLMQWHDERCDEHVAQLLNSLALHSSLVQSRDRGYSFAHYTLQEYLTALAYDRLPDGIECLLARRGEARWRETILLAAGYWINGDRPEKAQRLLEGLLNAGEAGATLLAGAALSDADAAGVPELRALTDTSAQRLRALAFDPAACPDARLRNHAAKLLDELGRDERPALDPSQPDYWATTIPPGPFLMGDDQDEYGGKPAFVHTIRQPYALARFPVTNRLYGRFLEALAAYGKLEEAQARRPHYWPGARYAAGEGNHPVAGVSWEDACAFARWANDTWLSEAERAAGQAIRLPSEPEWERAAAFPVELPAHDPAAGKRAYPWGDWPPLSKKQNDAIKGNSAANVEGELGRTSAVGIFPQAAAACGAEDLAGNVWEWCATPYQGYPLPEEAEAESIYTTAEYQKRTYVLRGGSWYGYRVRARCASRSGPNPDHDGATRGVHLARLFSCGSS
jgi:formylglycine-generating enzyme required for sulfatase activity